MDFNSKDWKLDDDSAKKKYNSSQEFIHNLIINLDYSLFELNHSRILLNEERTEILQPSLCKIFGLLLYSLP